MNAEPVTARRLGLGVLIAATLFTSACAAGQQAQTADQKPTLDGTEASVGDLKLRGLVIEAPKSATSYAAGSNVPVKLVLVNTGQRSDTLTSITSSAIAGWGSYASAADAAAVQAAASSSAAPPPASPSTPSPASSSASAAKTRPAKTNPAKTSPAQLSPATSPSSSAVLPSPQRSITVPAGSRVSWGVPDSKTALLLLGLTKRGYPGTAVTLKFTFQRAGSVTVLVPIALTDGEQLSLVPEPSAGGN